MAKKPASDNSEPVVGLDFATDGDFTVETVISRELPEVQFLKESGIITIADGAITWRAGHLEHIANLFAGDPATTERNYADDLAVARSYSAETWASLIEATK